MKGIEVGDRVFGRDVIALDDASASLKCACGSVSVIKRASVVRYLKGAPVGRCRACGYASAHVGHREYGGNNAGGVSRRLDICRAVAVEFALADTRTVEADPVAVAVLEWFEREGLGGMPFTCQEIGALSGMTRAGVGLIEARAIEKVRRGISNAMDVVETLRERDADRDWFPTSRAA